MDDSGFVSPRTDLPIDIIVRHSQQLAANSDESDSEYVEAHSGKKRVHSFAQIPPAPDAASLMSANRREAANEWSQEWGAVDELLDKDGYVISRE